MSHDVEKMMFTGKKPWWYGNAHQGVAVGVDLGENAVNSEVAMKEAGLDWMVNLRQVGFQDPTTLDIDGNPTWREADDQRVIVRSSDQQVLGICTDQYVPYQNAQAFEFLDGLALGGDLLYHTAGSLDQGGRVWILAQTPINWTVRRRSGAENTHHAFLLAMLGHNGNAGISLMPTDVRAECANTCGWAEQKAEGENLKFNIPHRGDISSKMELGALAIEKMYEAAPERREILQQLANRAMRSEEFIDFATSVFLGLDGEQEQVEAAVAKYYEDATDRSKTIMENKVAKVTELFMQGQGNEGDSTLDALNAFTEYFDHFDIGAIKNKVDSGLRAARAVKSSWIGAGAERKSLVFKRLKEMNLR